MSYRVVAYRGIDILAVPDNDRAVAIEGARSLFAASVSARLARASLAGCFWLGLGTLVGRRCESPFGSQQGFDWAAVLARLRSELRCETLLPVVVRPRRRRDARLYLHLFDADGRRTAFVKLVSDAGGVSGMRREWEALQRISRHGPRTFVAPPPLAYGAVERLEYMAVGALPCALRPKRERWATRLQEALGEIASLGERTHAAGAFLSWWSAWASAPAGSAAFRRLIDDSPVEVTVAHGDFAYWNMSRDERRRLVLIDWEAWCPDAPAMSDTVRFWLGLNNKAALRRPEETARRLRATPLLGGRNERDTAWALAFLHARGNADATAVANAWGRE